MITRTRESAFGYIINKRHYKTITKLTEDTFLLHEELFDHLMNSEYENTILMSPEEVLMMLTRDFVSFERVDMFSLPAVEAGDYQYYDTQMKINGMEVYVGYNTNTFQSLPLIGNHFTSHLRVQASIQSMRNSELPF